MVLSLKLMVLSLKLMVLSLKLMVLSLKLMVLSLKLMVLSPNENQLTVLMVSTNHPSKSGRKNANCRRSGIVRSGMGFSST